jgi:hypothetical protein
MPNITLKRFTGSVWEEMLPTPASHTHPYSALTGTVPTWNQNTTGSAATLTTARTLTIGSTGKTFNGGANVSWNLTEIGAAATNHGHGVTTIGDMLVSYDGLTLSRLGTSGANNRFLKVTLEGSDLIPSWNGITSSDVSDLSSNAVMLSGNQTVAGTKTFSNTPTLTAGAQVSLSSGSLSSSISFQSGQTYGGPAIRASATNLQRTYFTSTAILWDQENAFYTASSTTATTTAAKVATISGFQRNTGVMVSITFTNGSAVASPTLNISSTGAASIVVNGSAATVDNFSLNQNDTVLFRWNGASYEVLSVSHEGPRVINTGFTFDGTITDNTYYNVFGARFILLQGLTGGLNVFNLWIDMTDTNQVSTTARTHRIVWNNGTSTFSDPIQVQSSGTTVRFSSGAGGTWTYRLTAF